MLRIQYKYCILGGYAIHKVVRNRFTGAVLQIIEIIMIENKQPRCRRTNMFCQISVSNERSFIPCDRGHTHLVVVFAHACGLITTLVYSNSSKSLPCIQFETWRKRLARQNALKKSLSDITAYKKSHTSLDEALLSIIEEKDRVSFPEERVIVIPVERHIQKVIKNSLSIR